MTLTELKKLAKDKKLTGYSTLKKDELIELINK
ncbi:MAG: Rho termination factor N-terminal domain-containing protein [Bacilli bacterium]|nr:Rho termination factor N-terminal domain-containing protein [Bacilli bacterium]